MTWSHRETRISFHPLFLLLEIFSKSSYSFRTWMVSILSLHLRFKDLLDEKVLPRCGRKWLQVILSLLLSLFVFVCITCVFCFIVLSRSSFYALLCLTCFCFCFFVFFVFFLFFLFFCFFFFCFSYKNKKKKNWKNWKIQKQCVLCVHWYLCISDGHWNKVF